MKYPLLKIKYIPTFYKHCGKVIVFHMDFKNKGFLDTGNKTSKTAYLKSIQEHVYELIESFHTVNLATRVSSNNEQFVIFKTSLPEEQLLAFAKNLMAELSIYTNNEIEISYHILTVLLFEEDHPVKMTAMNKVGDDILASKEWEEQIHIYQNNAVPKGKYLKSYEEYVALHPIKEEQKEKTSVSNTGSNVNLSQSPKQNIDDTSDEEGFMYYI